MTTPLPPDIEKLLAVERRLPAARPGLAKAVLQRLEHSAAALAPVPALASAPPLKAGSFGAVLKSKVLVAVVSLGVGVGAGSAVRSFDSALPPPPIIVVVQGPAAVEPVEPTPLPAPVVEKGRVPVEARPPTRAPSTLAEERALLEVARTALVRQNSAGALGAVAEHRRRFSDGKLAEEREALWIQALVFSGQSAAAAEKATLFRRKYPHSVLLPAIAAALGDSVTDSGPRSR